MTQTAAESHGLITVTRDHLQTDEARQLFDSLLDAYDRGGGKEVRELMKNLIEREKELSEDDVARE